MSDLSARVRLTGDLDLRLGVATPVARLAMLEVETGGTFLSPEPPFRLVLEGRFGELRKLASAAPVAADLLALAPGVPDDATGQLRFLATDAHVRALGEALAGMEEPGPDQLFQNAAWVERLFDLGGYRGEAVAQVERGEETFSVEAEDR